MTMKRAACGWIAALAAIGMLAATPLRAGQAQPVADDTALESRVDALAAQLRCLVCQNQSLADSHAGLALDLKNQVREQLRAGGSEAQVIDYMTERYGDFVLYKPPFKWATLLLWAGPALLAALGLGLGWRSLNRSSAAADAGKAAPAPDAGHSRQGLDAP
jgi:cytochrome c-type biogenesis protein CcmH/NrfF